MSKVRVYELAKEFGLKSKELAEKLIAMGYPVASHSSSVDNDMAADIRRKLKSEGMTGPVDGRVGLRSRPEPGTPPKTRTVVRRRSKAEKDAARMQEEAEAQTLEAQAQEQAARDREQELAETADVAPLPHEPESIPVPRDAGEAVPPMTPEKPETAAEPMDADEEIVEESAEEQIAEEVTAADMSTDDHDLEDVGTPEQVDDSEMAAADDAAKPKPMARIVGRVVIPVPEKKTRAPVKRAGRPVKSPGTEKPADVLARDEGTKVDGKGKKKAKRVVAIKADEEKPGKKAVKAVKRGRDRVELSPDGDVEYMRPRKGRKKRDSARKEALSQLQTPETKAIKKRIKVVATISVGDLARRMGVKANEVIAALMGMGVLATLNQALDVETAALVATDFGYEVEQAMTEELEMEAQQEQEAEMGGDAILRPPVVTVMGHVDHGKTSILDAIRKTDVAAGEAGGITQHIGAYHVQAPSGDLTFVDTPGHAAFTEMRSRGAKVTDIVVLVVAADDGVMEQTKEAIAHSQAADVPIVVAVNKIDKDNADPDRVKRELSDYGLIPEEWGGQTIFCETSAKKGFGIEELLESIQLQAEILELRADPNRKAKGTVIEAQLHKGRGPVATVLVQDGTLHPGDHFVAGIYSGKVRMLTNERGEQVNEAGPAIPVEVQGLSGVPQAGDEFIVLAAEKMAKSVAASRQLKARETELASASKVSLENLFEKMAEQDVKELRVILRADVQGTLQAFGQAAENLSTDVIRVRSLHEGTGSITENDIHLAAASDAIIIGFNVRPTVKVKELAEREQVDIRTYDVIYHALEDIEKAMKGMLEPTFEERVIGTAEVRDSFQVPKVGLIAGCSVISGKMERNARVRVLREGVVVYTGKIASLRRFKDDVKEVLTGYECGIGVENFNDIKIGDHLEAFVLDEVEATL
ncbi:translation initiation factor IF-2 [Desulfobulbus alkaliphilus]|uniref:translation initiation factor IF-2 n=1 Tax=Desulfobulbus alkaliphilus TaxID=869814 RepID=UPI00196658C9|nr:translation initiation factor IF-2 [Desulfobulbus alkaliphilus]MBM9536880.1 translation initiation factor IF-2 [Desulfobulbus alkaliphilus]